MAQVEKLVSGFMNLFEAFILFVAQADETTEVIKIPHSYHSGLIGSAGKYVNRLEEKYVVKINFGDGDESRSGRNREAAALKPDEVMIKGGKKGVASAKNELLEVRQTYGGLAHVN